MVNVAFDFFFNFNFLKLMNVQNLQFLSNFVRVSFSLFYDTFVILYALLFFCISVKYSFVSYIVVIYLLSPLIDL